MRAALAALCVVVGLVLVARPFTSLTVLVLAVAGAALLTAATQWSSARDSGSMWGRAGAGLWAALGVAALAWPDRTVVVVAVLAGLAMVVAGATDVADGLTGSSDHRFASVVRGAAGVVLGGVALAWPEVTILVVAVALGVRTTLYGLTELHAPDPERWWWRVGRSAGAVLALVVALVLGAASVAVHRARPETGAFHDPPDTVPDRPGALLRHEPYEDAPAGTAGWRILYTTTRADGVPAVASGIVLVPSAAGASLPVVAWAHGTTGVARACAPSVLDDGLAAGAFHLAGDVAEQGWAVVAPDYVGLGADPPHPYLVGDPSGRSVLDAVRAARELPVVDLADDTVVWGHSQGGGAALWAGRIAPTYAPDAGVLGVAALAPASDLPALVDRLEQVPGGSLFAAYVLTGYAAAYDDVRVDDHVRPTARPAVRAMAARCLSFPDLLPGALQSLAVGMSGFVGLEDGPLLGRLAENVPVGPYDVPLLVAQGEDDGLILPEVQAGFVERLCAGGDDVDYRSYPGRGHVPLVEADSPLVDDLITWTADRFAGNPAETTCR